MRRKIALFLAFAMVFALAPANINAAWTRPQHAGNASLNSTGNRWESTVANNVRHFGDGVVVGTQETASRINRLFNGITPAAGGNLRSIMVASDYFILAPVGENHARLRVQLSNAARFALAPAGDNTQVEGTRVASREMVDDVFPGFRQFVDSDNGTWPDGVPLPGLTTGVTYTGTQGAQVASLNGLELLAELALVGGMTTNEAIREAGPAPNPSTWITNERVVPSGLVDNTAIVPAGSVAVYRPNTARIIAYARNLNPVPGQGDSHGIYSPNTSRLAQGQITWAAEYELRGPAPANTPLGTLIVDPNGNILGSAANTRNSANAWGNAMLPGSGFIPEADANIDPIDGLATILPELRNTFRGMWEEVLAINMIRTAGGEWFIAALIRDVQAGNNVATLHVFRTAGFPTQATGGAPFVTLPIEYITNGDTNDNPVFVTLTHTSGWAQAGGASFRTDLTSTATSRFNFTRGGDVRNFSRYGTTLIGGDGRDHGIRIEEGAQNAFNQRSWWVEMQIVTPGYFWTAESVNSMNNPNATFNGNPNVTTRYTDTGTTHLANQPNTGNAVRVPDSQVVNRFHTLQFGLELGDNWAIDQQRLVNDWVNFRNLHIGADDRARPGPVEVEVRLYSNGLQGMGNTEGNVLWQWNITWYGEAAALDTTTGQFTPDALRLQSLSWAAMNNINPGPNLSYTITGDMQSGPSTPTPGIPGSPVPDSVIAVFVSSRITQPGTTGGLIPTGRNPGQDSTASGRVTVGNFGEVGLTWEVHSSDNPTDFVLRSGMQSWGIDETVVGGGGWSFATGSPLGAVIGQSAIDDTHHKTARGVLRETVAGSLPATGASPITFEFNEGVEVLGARLWTNNANFSRYNDTNGWVWYGQNWPAPEADNFLNTSVNPNSLQIRPEIGNNVTNRWQNAQITVEFYVSVMPGYEHYYGNDEITVTASGNVDGQNWSDTIVLAYAWDPITVETSPVVIDENNSAAAGIIRQFNVNDVVISETKAGALEVGSRLWIGIEGGVSRSWGSADSLSLGSFDVQVVGDDYMQLSAPRQDSHGTFVEIVRSSRTDGAQVVFSNIVVSGNVFPDSEYGVFVADSAVAANWDGFNWINTSGNMGFSRGAVRGFFANEPYLTTLFSFAGHDIFAPAPPTTLPSPTPTPDVTTPTPTVPVVPRMVQQHVPFATTRGGENPISPAFEMVNNPTNPQNATAFLATAVVRDILAWEDAWDPAAQTGTFTTPDGRVIVFTAGSSTVTVNGAPMQLLDTENAPVNAYINPANGRFMVPIRFFTQLGVNVNWLGGTNGQFSMMVG